MIHFKISAFPIGNDLTMDIDISSLTESEIVMMLEKAMERNDKVKEFISAAFFSYCMIMGFDPMQMFKSMYLDYQKRQPGQIKK